MLRAATRGSALARWQASHVAGLLGVPVEVVVVETTGDRRQDLPISAIGGTGVFVKEVQAAVLDGRADFAVHSAKDLPSESHPDLVIAAVPERGDPRDVLVGSRLEDLPSGAVVATGSVRRRVQLAERRTDITFTGLRGNIGTRLAKASSYDAVVMAAAALQRLGKESHIAEVLSVDVMLPQVGQGALAVECRPETAERLAAIEHAPSRLAVDAERAFLAELGGGCDLPVGAYATVERGQVTLRGLLATADGHVVLRGSATGSDPVEVGRGVAARLLASLPRDEGGSGS
ncbi:MAG TPA: hydroxymethylbilane synthase [Acidimicrobiales bacterium]|nr:hydroxymethylbilane synthase [Acidimicrobiales bacterium]